MMIDIVELTNGRTTYSNRGGVRYELQNRPANSSTIEIYYVITKGAARRIVSRRFPRFLEVSKRFIWALGLLRGEGLRSVGPRSSMYRFCVVNNDLAVIKAVIRVLNESGLAKFDEIKGKNGLIRISYGPSCDTGEAWRYWAEGLGIDASRVQMAKEAQPQKRAPRGSCMLTLNDVLLRRVVDLVAENVYDKLFGND